MLTGVGGDDVFDGDYRLFADAFRHGRWLSAMHGAITLKAYGTSTTLDRLRNLVLRPVLQAMVPRTWLTATSSLRRPLPFPWAGRRLRELIGEGLLREDGPHARERPSERSWLCDAMRSPRYALWKESRAQIEITGGCTRAEPYFDDDLVEFLASLRPDILFHGGWVRGLFRHSVRGMIPDDVRTRRDKGRYETAFVELLQAAGGFKALRPLLTMVGLGDYGVVEPSAMRRRFADLEANPLDGRLWMELWPVLAAEAFVRGPSTWA